MASAASDEPASAHQNLVRATEQTSDRRDVTECVYSIVHSDIVTLPHLQHLPHR
jgi:hypothetical protein